MNHICFNGINVILGNRVRTWGSRAPPESSSRSPTTSSQTQISHGTSPLTLCHTFLSNNLLDTGLVISYMDSAMKKETYLAW